MSDSDQTRREGPETATTHRGRLTGLFSLLREAEYLWRPRPFTSVEVPWGKRHPEVVSWCEALSEDAVADIETADRLPADAPSSLLAWQSRILEAIGPGPRISSSDRVDDVHCAGEGNKRLASLGAGVFVDGVTAWQVPARKLDQVQAFTEFASPIGLTAKRIVDWCGGKGHLGRILGERLGLPVRVIERESNYRDDALALAGRASVHLEFVCADALSPEVDGHLDETTLAVGLHACGNLGTRLLARAVHSRVAAICLAPCCLHKEPALRDGTYRWVSRLATEVCGALELDHSAMRLATSDEVVARPSIRAQRRRENGWRLGLDLLLQDSHGGMSYTPLGTLPHEALRQDFAHFVRTAASLRSLSLPETWDAGAYEARGLARARRARAMGLVRSMFRRAIEVLCAVDRAAFLAESGYDSEVVVFTSRAVTPRNLLIVATPAGAVE
jgi:hypothetical protein